MHAATPHRLSLRVPHMSASILVLVHLSLYHSGSLSLRSWHVMLEMDWQGRTLSQFLMSLGFHTEFILVRDVQISLSPPHALHVSFFGVCHVDAYSARTRRTDTGATFPMTPMCRIDVLPVW